jgi:hypothetical protein
MYSPPWLDRPSGPRPPHCWGFEITFRYITLRRTSLGEWSACHGDLQLTTHNTYKREREIYVPGDIWTRNPNKQVAADSCLRPHSHQDQHIQLHSYNSKLISEQTTGESNPLFKIARDLQLQNTNTTEYTAPIHFHFSSIPCQPLSHLLTASEIVLCVYSCCTFILCLHCYILYSYLS